MAATAIVGKGKGTRPASPTGTTISYVDSLPARTTVTIQRAAPGVRKGKRCVAPPPTAGRASASGTACDTWWMAARFVHVDRAGRFPTALPGVRKGKRCVAPPAHRRRGQGEAQALHAPRPDANHDRLRRPRRGRALAPGRYRLQAVAKIDGLRSRTVTVSFSIER